MDRSRDTAPRRERGAVILWSTLFLLLLLGFVAIGIDVAKVMATRTELQNAADAAALSGASAVDLATGQLRPDSALVRAQRTARRNEAFVDDPRPVTLLAGDVAVNAAARTVKVTVRRNTASDGPMVTHIGQVLGISSVDLSATATARADYVSEECDRLAPLGALAPATGFTIGQVYTLMNSTGTMGNYQAVDYPACDEGACTGMPSTGANTFECLLANGYGCCIKIGQTIMTEPGKMAGKTTKGLQTRWDADTDRRTTIAYQNYTGNGQRVVNVPVISTPGSGKSVPVTVLGFAAFFLVSRPNGGALEPIVGEYIYDVVPGSGGGPAGTVLSLRLIQ